MESSREGAALALFPFQDFACRWHQPAYSIENGDFGTSPFY
jgi:hypothetical protein